MRIYFAIQCEDHKLENSLNARVHLIRMDVSLKNKNRASALSGAEDERSYSKHKLIRQPNLAEEAN